MNKVIDTLYESQMDKSFDKFMGQYKEDKEIVFQGYQKLKSQLSVDQAEALEKIMDKQFDQMELELRESFSEGFRLGAKIMCEIFEKEETIISQNGKL